MCFLPENTMYFTMPCTGQTLPTWGCRPRYRPWGSMPPLITHPHHRHPQPPKTPTSGHLISHRQPILVDPNWIHLVRGGADYDWMITSTRKGWGMPRPTRIHPWLTVANEACLLHHTCFMSLMYGDHGVLVVLWHVHCIVAGFSPSNNVYVSWVVT